MKTIRPLWDRNLVKRIEDREIPRNGVLIQDGAKEEPQEGEPISPDIENALNQSRS